MGSPPMMSEFSVSVKLVVSSSLCKVNPVISNVLALTVSEKKSVRISDVKLSENRSKDGEIMSSSNSIA